MEKPPAPEYGNPTITDFIRAGVAAVPGVGGFISVLLDASLQKPQEKKMMQWYEDVARSVSKIESDFENLATNEGFRDTLISAYRVAQTTSTEAKLNALRNAVTNSVTESRPSEEKRLRFLRIIQEMVPEHAVLLKPEGLMQLGDGLFNTFAFHSVPGFDKDAENRIRKDLEFWGLAIFVDEVTPHGTISHGEITKLGEEFLSFIADPQLSDS